MELVIVVAIMSVIAVVAVSRVGRVGTTAQRIAAENDLKVLREAFIDEETGYLHDFRGIPGFSLGSLRLANLLMPTNLYVRLAGEADDHAVATRDFLAQTLHVSGDERTD